MSIFHALTITTCRGRGGGGERRGKGGNASENDKYSRKIIVEGSSVIIEIVKKNRERGIKMEI